MATDSAAAHVAVSSAAPRSSAGRRVLGLTSCGVATVALRDLAERTFGLLWNPHAWSLNTSAGVVVWLVVVLALAAVSGVVATHGLAPSWGAAAQEVVAVVCAGLAAPGATVLLRHPASVSIAIVWFVVFFGCAVWLLGGGTRLLPGRRRASVGRDAALALVIGTGLLLGSELVTVAWFGGIALTAVNVLALVVLAVVTLLLVRPAALDPRVGAALVGVGAAATALWGLVLFVVARLVLGKPYPEAPLLLLLAVLGAGAARWFVGRTPEALTGTTEPA